MARHKMFTETTLFVELPRAYNDGGLAGMTR